MSKVYIIIKQKKYNFLGAYNKQSMHFKKYQICMTVHGKMTDLIS